MPLTTSDNLLSNTSPEDVLLCKQTNKVYSMSIIAFKMGYMAQWVECQTRHQSIVGSSSVKGSSCFIEQETLTLLLSICLFHEWIQVDFPIQVKSIETLYEINLILSNSVLPRLRLCDILVKKNPNVAYTIV